MGFDRIERHANGVGDLLRAHVFRESKEEYPALIHRKSFKCLLHLNSPFLLKKKGLRGTFRTRHTGDHLGNVDRRRANLPPELKTSSSGGGPVSSYWRYRTVTCSP